MSTAPPSPCVLHLDVDAFFASVEQRDDPRLRGLPVAVGTGVVASCSYESRRWGVRTGMRLAEARRLCPALRVLPGDYRRYELAARRVLGVCHDLTPRVEVAALDDLYLDLTPLGLAGARRAALELAAQVHAEVGLNVSLGLAANKLVAAVATDEVKRLKAASDLHRGPRVEDRGSRIEDRGRTAGAFFDPRSSILYPRPSVRVVPPGGERVYLAPWPVEALPGVGPKALSALGRVNVRTAGQLADLPLAVVSGLLGPRGPALRELARGVDPRPVEPHSPPRSVSRRTSFDPPACEGDFLLAMLDHLLERAVAWLRLRRLAARALSVGLCYGDYRWAEGRTGLGRPTDDFRVLRESARDRFARLYARRLPLRALGVSLADLRERGGQGELFADPQAEKARRLAECQEAVRRRFGFLALVSGSSLVLRRRLEHDRENYRLRTPCLTR